jgi:hypothetical protein
MKKIIVISLIAMLVSCGSVMAGAPNSGDGELDGSGWEDIPPQDGEVDPNPNPDAECPGPAPSSGDGDPDGPGWP